MGTIMPRWLRFYVVLRELHLVYCASGGDALDLSDQDPVLASKGNESDW